MSSLIKINKDAIIEVSSLILEENNLNLNLRVYITGGGCSGFKYAFAFDECIRPDDAVVKIDEATENHENDKNTVQFNILIDPLSLQYLRGADIGYCRDINGSRFTISNPNAKTTCGCGSSFSV